MTRIPSRMLREAAQRQAAADDLAAFVELLLDALEIPEVRAAVAASITPRAPASSPSGRGRIPR